MPVSEPTKARLLTGATLPERVELEPQLRQPQASRAFSGSRNGRKRTTRPARKVRIGQVDKARQVASLDRV
jgi:hypothetical protein